MAYKISKDVIHQTKKCRHNFECLNGNLDNCSCSAHHYLGVGGVVLKNDDKINCFCDYLTTRGHSLICSCPTRIELLEKYDL